jgi:hypothetical protein
MPNHQTRTVFGPFHRLLAPKVQDTETVIKQLMSGEIWGYPANWGGTPAVKAIEDSNEVAKLQVAFVRITQDLLP